MGSMADNDEQDDLEIRIAEAIALAETVVGQNIDTETAHSQIKETISDQHAENTEDKKISEPEPDRTHEAVWKVVLVSALCVLAVCVVLTVRHITAHYRSVKVNETLRSYVDYSTDDKNENTSEETTLSERKFSGETYPDVNVDFAKLQAVNADICAWVYIPGTDVDYPVMQGDDNSYYLTHDAYREYSPDGSVFMDCANSKKFVDFNTVIYGHNMSSGTMFKTLHNYENEDFWKTNRNVYIYLPDAVICYKVFAAYRTDDRHIFTYNDFGMLDVRQTYLDNIFDGNFDTGTVKNDEKIDVDSRILTLSTCCGMDGKRWLVQAVLRDKIKYE